MVRGPSAALLGGHFFCTSKSLWVGTHSPWVAWFNVAALTCLCKQVEREQASSLGMALQSRGGDGGHSTWLALEALGFYPI